MNVGTQAQGVTIKAVVYPKCACGRTYMAHLPEGCNGYSPVRPVEDKGTRAYTPRPGLSLLSKLRCNLYWSIERRLQARRERLEDRR